MAKQTDIEERLKSLVADMLGCEKSQVVADARFAEDLGADSLDQVELVMAVEEEFDISVDDEQAEKCDTFGKALAIVMESCK